MIVEEHGETGWDWAPGARATILKAMTRTIIAGGRDLPEDMTFWPALDDARAVLGITEVVCGGARGGDTIGRLWAEDHGIPVKMFPADWSKHGRAAGPIRNQQMAEYADALVALPGGKGTADMIQRAQRRGMKVIEVKR